MPSGEASAVPAAADILLANDEGGGFSDELAQAVLASGAFLDHWSTCLGSPSLTDIHTRGRRHRADLPHVAGENGGPDLRAT